MTMQQKICPQCRQSAPVEAQACPYCRHVFQTQSGPADPSQGGAWGKPSATAEFDSSKKLAAGLCGILLGTIGVHKSILGYNTEGLTMLLVSLLTCGIGSLVMWPIGVIEGILYLTKSDEEFYRTYVLNKKGWF